ncbi:RNA-binding protein [Acaryochloris marina]|uniref:RNA recognition motif domain-containing protein n=1 Tax=Acaryochloris marina TaxID=155978 RepID=UPI001BB0B068|nr:RNA-binding protein [Acaryochloris marina]QUY45714.1 RNA-binding protein [Acaryochloris marina S15]
MSIYVGNLSYEVTEEALNKIFAEYGAVQKVNIPTDRETGKIRGFGFVKMIDETEAAQAIEDLNGAEWMGRTLKVNMAKPRASKGG